MSFDISPLIRELRCRAVKWTIIDRGMVKRAPRFIPRRNALIAIEVPPHLSIGMPRRSRTSSGRAAIVLMRQ